MNSLALVDSHPILRFALRSALESSGDLNVVAESGDGAEAFEMILEHKPDLVILELDLPGMGGLELIECVRRSAPSTKTIVLTGLPSSFTMRAWQAGVGGILMKTTKLPTLVHSIKSVLAGYCIFPTEAYSRH